MAHIKVYAGPMWSRKGKRIKDEREQALIAGRTVLVIKPERDTRNKNVITAREFQPDGSSVLKEEFPAIEIKDAEHLKRVFAEHHFDVLIADECQFFPGGESPKPGEPYEPGWFAKAIDELADLHAHNDDLQIILSGLDLDSMRAPFGAMRDLLCLADEVVKTSGVCMNKKCRSFGARFSQKLRADGNQYKPGDGDSYQIRCRSCHDPVR